MDLRVCTRQFTKVPLVSTGLLSLYQKNGTPWILTEKHFSLLPLSQHQLLNNCSACSCSMGNIFLPDNLFFFTFNYYLRSNISVAVDIRAQRFTVRLI